MKCLGCCKHCGKIFVQGNGSNDRSSSSNHDGSIIGQQSRCKFSHAQRQVIGYRGKFLSANYCEPKASWSFSTFLSSLRQQQEPQQQRRDETNAMIAYIEIYWRLWAAGNTLRTEKDEWMSVHTCNRGWFCPKSSTVQLFALRAMIWSLDWEEIQSGGEN